MPLASAQSDLLKRVRTAAAKGRPTEEGLVVAEGPHLLREALRSPWQVRQIFCTEAASQKHSDLLHSCRAKIHQVTARAMASTAATEATQEIITTLAPRPWTWPDLFTESALVLVLDGVQDPGNAGTIIRSAEAFGATGAVFLDGCVRVSNSKFLRATAGSIFRLPFLESISVPDFLGQAQHSRASVFSLAMRRSIGLQQANLRDRCALVVGSEGAGVRADLLDFSRAISIPTRKVESLNAAVACSIALYEAHAQRTRS